MFLACPTSKYTVAVLRKWRGCGTLEVILRTERNRFHRYLHPIHKASLPSRDDVALYQLVPAASPELTLGGQTHRRRATGSGATPPPSDAARARVPGDRSLQVRKETFQGTFSERCMTYTSLCELRSQQHIPNMIDR